MRLPWGSRTFSFRCSPGSYAFHFHTGHYVYITNILVKHTSGSCGTGLGSMFWAEEYILRTHKNLQFRKGI